MDREHSSIILYLPALLLNLFCLIPAARSGDSEGSAEMKNISEVCVRRSECWISEYPVLCKKNRLDCPPSPNIEMYLYTVLCTNTLDKKQILEIHIAQSGFRNVRKCVFPEYVSFP